jgi:anti-sigma-K factor RskA
MIEKGPLEKLLQRWQAPAPRADLEPRVLQRLRRQPPRKSLWQRWFAEPWEFAGSLWRPQAVAVAGVAILAVAAGIGLNVRRPGATADLGLNAFSTFPKGSLTQSYLEMIAR